MGLKHTENCRRIAGGVAAGLLECRDCPLEPAPLEPAAAPMTAAGRTPAAEVLLWLVVALVAPMLRGSVCDLFMTPRLPGRLLPTVNLRPDAVRNRKYRRRYGGECEC